MRKNTTHFADIHRVVTAEKRMSFEEACAFVKSRRQANPNPKSGEPLTAEEKEALIVIAMEWKKYGRITRGQALALMKGEDPPPGVGPALS